MRLSTEKKCILLFVIALFLLYIIKKNKIVDGMSNETKSKLEKIKYLVNPKKKVLHEHTILHNHDDKDNSMYVRFRPEDKPKSLWHAHLYDNFY